MNLLFITTQFPYPLDNGGKIGAFNGISVVSDQYDVTVLSFTEEPQYVGEGVKYFQSVLPDVKFDPPIYNDIHIRKKPVKLVRTMTRDYIQGLPYVTAKFVKREMFARIDRKFKEQYWDRVFIDYLNMNVYGAYIRSKYQGKYGHLILKDHNIEYEIVKQAAEDSTGIKKKILEAEWKRTFRYESNAIRNAELAFSVCDENTAFLKRYNKNSYTMLPTYEMLPHREHFETRPNILFMGNLSWGANMKGLKWFVGKVLPLVKRNIPEAKLTVVGSGPAVNPFAGNESVDYRGYVKDINHIYDDQRVFIVPLFEGSGIRIKILEAFNNEIPVVSTQLGCGTIKAREGQELFIADDPDSFAEDVINLLKNEELARTMARKAKDYLGKNFSLKSRQEEYQAIEAHAFHEKERLHHSAQL